MAEYIAVYLVRHGLTDLNLLDIHKDASAKLNETGKKQAEKMAEFFRDIPLTAIYSSPTCRTLQTIQPILKHHKLKIIQCRGFTDRNQGGLIGLAPKQIQELIPDLEKQWARDGVDWHPPGNGESVRDAFQRSISEFNRIIQKHKPGDAIIIMTHASIIKCLLPHFNEKNLEDIFEREKPGHCEVIEVLWDKGPKKIQCVLK